MTHQEKREDIEQNELYQLTGKVVLSGFVKNDVISRKPFFKGDSVYINFKNAVFQVNRDNLN